MAFTDRDLKRWTKKLSRDTYWACCFDDKNKFEALIDRLECAELCARYLRAIPDDSLAPVEIEALKTWRLSRGEERQQ